MALGLVAEEATMYADDLESEFKRALLASLKASLSAVLPTLTGALCGPVLRPHVSHAEQDSRSSYSTCFQLLSDNPKPVSAAQTP
jgi:hypothetical protein